MTETPAAPTARRVYDLLAFWSDHTPDATALLAPGRPPLSFGRLFGHVRDTLAMLRAFGVARADRVALVLPNGPEAATAFLAAAAGAVAAPLNPDYRQGEFEFYLADVRARAVVVPAGIDSPGRAAARACRVPLLELAGDAADPAGLFRLRGESIGAKAADDLPGPEDVALLLHTSGTTARPKLVPILQRHLGVTADDIRGLLCLTPADRCLAVTPFFHRHGLVASLLSGLGAGGSVICPSGFSAAQFFEWLKTLGPTWYSAVPVMHQAVLAQARGEGLTRPQHRLRVIRSSSAPLSAAVRAGLEELFGVPVSEGYGITEVARQLASTPLPPEANRPGAVGRVSGPNVAIMHEGRLVPPGVKGEVVACGPDVITGYENGPPDDSTFAGGWYHTGDQGYVDADGYLFLTGRIKELINRGGEKVSPPEVEEALRKHPAVAEALAFALPHPRLGEDVGAAVVLRTGSAATPTELIRFAAGRLADVKVPSRVVIVEDLPRNAVGKPQRVGAAERLGLTGTPAAHAAQPYEAPGTEVECNLAAIWARVLGVPRVGRGDNFFDLGGDSLLAEGLLSQVEKGFGRRLTPSALHGAPTLAQLADVLTAGTASAAPVTLASRGTLPPLFCMPSPGEAGLYFMRLVQCLAPDHPFYIFRAPPRRTQQRAHREVVELAADYVAEMRKFQPEGPYHLVGYSFGGIVATEIAQQLRAKGHKVALLALLDTRCHGHVEVREGSLSTRLRSHWRFLRGHLEGFRRLRGSDRWRYIMARLTNIRGRLARRVHIYYHGIGRRARGLRSWASGSAIPAAEVFRPYAVGTYSGPITLFRAQEQPAAIAHEAALGWDRVAAGGLKILVVPGDHGSFLDRDNINSLGERLREELAALGNESKRVPNEDRPESFRVPQSSPMFGGRHA